MDNNTVCLDPFKQNGCVIKYINHEKQTSQIEKIVYECVRSNVDINKVKSLLENKNERIIYEINNVKHVAINNKYCDIFIRYDNNIIFYISIHFNSYQISNYYDNCKLICSTYNCENYHPRHYCYYDKNLNKYIADSLPFFHYDCGCDNDFHNYIRYLYNNIHN